MYYFKTLYVGYQTQSDFMGSLDGGETYKKYPTEKEYYEELKEMEEENND